MWYEHDTNEDAEFFSRVDILRTTDRVTGQRIVTGYRPVLCAPSRAGDAAPLLNFPIEPDYVIAERVPAMFLLKQGWRPLAPTPGN
jgi:hypothetical protein